MQTPRISMSSQSIANSLKRQKWIYILWGVFLINSILVSFTISAVTKDSNTAAGFGLQFLDKKAKSDSWYPMLQAIHYMRTDSGIPVYTKIFFNDNIKFQYPVSSLLPVDLLQLTDLDRPDRQLFSILNDVSWWCVIATGLVTWLLLKENIQKTTPEKFRHALSAGDLLTFIPTMGIALTFYPLVKSYTLGQIQTEITLAVAVAVYFWQHDRRGFSGLLLGLCCAAKPQWTIVILWGAIRKEWRFAIAGGLTFASLTLISIGRYGIQNYLDYLPVMSFLSGHGESFYANQSINGLMNRLLFNGPNLDFPANDFPPFNPTVYAVTMVSTIIILGSALLWRWNKKANVLDLSLFILSLTMASPIAWEHHYAILLPIFAVMTPIVLSNQILGKYTNIYIAIAFFLSSQFLIFTNLLAKTPFNYIQSYLLFGAVMAAILLYRITTMEQDKQTRPSS